MLNNRSHHFNGGWNETSIGKEVIEGPLTARFWILSAVLTAVLSFVSTSWVFMQSGQCLLSLSILSGITYFMPLVFMSLFFIVIMSRTKWLGRRINIVNVTYLYTILASLAWQGNADVIFIPGTYWTSKALYVEASWLTPWWFAPLQQICQQIMGSGGLPIPWMEYMPSILWWWWIYALWALFMIGLTAILRHQWIDVEQVPFPQTMVAFELARAVESKTRLKSREWLVGMILGGAFVITMFMVINFPWFPDIYGWRTNTCTSGLTYIAPDSLFGGIVAFVGSSKQPLYIAIAYLAPLTILFNIWFWWVILAVLTQVAYTFGYYTGMTGNPGCGRLNCAGGVEYGPPFFWQVFESVGLQVGIVLGYIIVNRKYLAGTVKAALGRQTDLKDIEKDEPIRYRHSWILCIVTSILLAISFLTCGINFASAWVTVIVTIFYAFCWARTWGLSGFWASTGYNAGFAYYKWIWPTAPTPITLDWSLSMNLAFLPATNVPYGGWQHPLLTTMASSRLASLTKTNQKNVFKIAIFVSLLTPICTTLVWLWMLYTWGFGRSPSFTGGLQNSVTRLTADYVNARPATGVWWPQVLAGVITAVVLSYLHARFIWFPLEPIGMLVGISSWNMLLGLWQSAAIAWVLKVLTLRIGGSKAYEKHGQPVAGGFFVGYALAILVVGIVGIYRFFFPF